MTYSYLDRISTTNPNSAVQFNRHPAPRGGARTVASEGAYFDERPADLVHRSFRARAVCSDQVRFLA